MDDAGIPEYHCTEGHPIQPADWLMVRAYRCHISDLKSDLAAAEKQGDADHTACVEYAAQVRTLESAIREAQLAIACGGAASLVIERVTAALGSAAGKEV